MKRERSREDKRWRTVLQVSGPLGEERKGKEGYRGIERQVKEGRHGAIIKWKKGIY